MKGAFVSYMRQKRTDGKKAISLIGYHPSDVEETLRLLDKQIAHVDTVITQERQSFVSLFYRKTMQVEQLQTMLQEALATETEMMRRRMPL